MKATRKDPLLIYKFYTIEFKIKQLHLACEEHKSIIVFRTADLHPSGIKRYLRNGSLSLSISFLIHKIQEKGSNRCKSFNRDSILCILILELSPAAKFMHEGCSVILTKIYVNIHCNRRIPRISHRFWKGLT